MHYCKKRNISHLKWLIIFIIILNSVFTASYSQESKQKGVSKKVLERIEYINRYKDLAISQMKEYNIPASITLAQACLESANGKSELAVKSNNHFGIKCHNDWTGATVRHDDDAKNECFRKYSSVLQSYRDHSEYLKTKKRYASLFNLKITDYKGWAKGLKAAGYATNPNYAKELINIIEDYELYKYDHLGYNKGISIAEMKKEKIKFAEKDMELEGLGNKAQILESSPLYTINTNRQLYQEEGRAYIFANEGDTYESIAKEYNLFNREIRRYNRVKRKDIPRPGEKVFLEK